MKTKFLFICIILASISISSAQTTEEPVVGIQLGNKAPEITMKGPDGKEYSLSSLKGSIVLIDFWATWCTPCRRENPNVVAAYNKYNKAQFKDAKSFEVFSVALERPGSIDVWKQAISMDKLTWPYHVSDFQWWNSAAAQLYQINSIPASFLIDKNGIIIGRDLTGKLLKDKLQSLIKQ